MVTVSSATPTATATSEPNMDKPTDSNLTLPFSEPETASQRENPYGPPQHSECPFHSAPTARPSTGCATPRSTASTDGGQDWDLEASFSGMNLDNWGRMGPPPTPRLPPTRIDAPQEGQGLQMSTGTAIESQMSSLSLSGTATIERPGTPRPSQRLKLTLSLSQCRAILALPTETKTPPRNPLKLSHREAWAPAKRKATYPTTTQKITKAHQSGAFNRILKLTTTGTPKCPTTTTTSAPPTPPQTPILLPTTDSAPTKTPAPEGYGEVALAYIAKVQRDIVVRELKRRKRRVQRKLRREMDRVTALFGNVGIMGEEEQGQEEGMEIEREYEADAMMVE